VGTTTRNRFVTFNLGEGWVELQRKPIWMLAHPDRSGGLTISMNPLAQGTTLDLATLQARREHGRPHERLMRRSLDRVLGRHAVLDNASWSEAAVFCLVTSVRVEQEGLGGVSPWPRRPGTSYARYWTVSDGAHLTEAALRAFDERASARAPWIATR
jgi:hypothetical protein